MHKIYDWDYSDYYHGLTKIQYNKLQNNGRVWIKLN